MNLILNTDALFQLGFYLCLFIFVVHAIVFAYHWISFGAERATSLAGIAVYLVGGAVLILFLSIALNFI